MGSLTSSSSSSDGPLHIAFLPLMNPGNTIPAVDLARHLACRGVRSTVITTPSNAAAVASTVSTSAALGHPISLLTIPFPSSSLTGLPPHIDDLTAVPHDLFLPTVISLRHLAADLSALLSSLRPHALISHALLPFSATVAADLGISRVIFQGDGAFSRAVFSSLGRYFPFPESFTVSHLPHPIQIYRDCLPEMLNSRPLLQSIGEAEKISTGILVNTFHGMEPDYVDELKCRKPTWCFGPVCLLNPAMRGGSPEERDRILGFLDRQPTGSVIYVCFGSMCRFGAKQLEEIAKGLEASGRGFLWVVKKGLGWRPEEGFEVRTKGRGLVVVGWAPQVEVLGHVAVGWFVTHCGWNSIQEAACAGKPMVTWPLGQDQNVNAEMVVEVMGAGVRMWEGPGKKDDDGAAVMAEEVAEIIGKVTGGDWEAAEKAKERATEYKETARAAVEEGGSTYEDLTRLIQELDMRRKEVRKTEE
ncbi:scopoletin glucosyltransferase-like [Typha angustifolia]|uniref:scopoletin glucosyltransferase-like n=1 Tax=Typha angustifolia TaxID=59011 RepID=UPI003C2C47C3